MESESLCLYLDVSPYTAKIYVYSRKSNDKNDASVFFSLRVDSVSYAHQFTI